LTRIDSLNQTAKIIHAHASAPNSSRFRPGALNTHSAPAVLYQTA
jgi:hypothetical protein